MSSMRKEVQPEQDRTRRYLRSGWFLAIWAILGVLAVLFITAWGIGISRDSVVYLDTAKKLLQGSGFRTGAEDGVLKPLTQYPPLVPAMSALAALAGGSPADGTRWLNALLFGGTILLAGGMVQRYTRGAFWATVLSGFFVLTGVTVLHVHVMAWSEPLFIFSGLLGLFLLSAYLRNASPGLLIASAGAIALTCLTRYIGITFIAAGMLGLLLFDRKPLVSRAFHAGVFLALSTFPLAIWMFRNIRLPENEYFQEIAPGGSATAAQWYRMVNNLQLGLQDIFIWALPRKIPVEFRAGALVALAAVLIAMSVVLLKRRTGAAGTSLMPVDYRSLPYLLIFFIIAYMVSLSAAIVTTGQGTLGFRHMSVVYVAAIVLVACWLYRLSGLLRAAPGWRALLIVLLSGLVLIHLGYSAIWSVRRYSQQGMGLAEVTWRESSLMQELRALAPGTQVVTTNPAAVYWLSGHFTHPIQFGPGTDALTSEDYLAYLQAMVQQFRGQPVVLACLQSDQCEALARESYAGVILRTLAGDQLGTIYSVENSAAER